MAGKPPAIFCGPWFGWLMALLVLINAIDGMCKDLKHKCIESCMENDKNEEVRNQA